MNITYHLVPQAYYDAQDPRADYVPRDFAREGFIHCTDGTDEMARIANLFYKNSAEPHYYLTIDKTRVRAEIRYEDPVRVYPHIYGALNRDAIVAIRPARRAADGAFLPPESLE
jgi:glutathione S-transferase